MYFADYTSAVCWHSYLLNNLTVYYCIIGPTILMKVYVFIKSKTELA
jgi:hypothetical protein